MSQPKQPKPESAILSIRVTPKASQSRIQIDEAGLIKAWVTAAPTDGEANEAVCQLFAKALKVPKSSVEIASGHTHRNKVLQVANLSLDEAMRRLG